MPSMAVFGGVWNRLDESFPKTCHLTSVSSSSLKLLVWSVATPPAADLRGTRGSLGGHPEGLIQRVSRVSQLATSREG